MATIGAITLAITTNIGNANITVTYQITGSAFDVASGQPYRERVRLIGDDTGLVPAEDNSDNDIVGGQLADTTVVFPNATSISRTRTATLLKTSLNEDNPGTDEIRAVVTLTPIPAATASRESNMVTGNFN